MVLTQIITHCRAVMADERKRAAAICENCGFAFAAHIGSDGEIRPIGTETEDCCSCERANFRLVNNDIDMIDKADSKNSQLD